MTASSTPSTPLCPLSPSQAKLMPPKHASNSMNLWVLVVTDSHVISFLSNNTQLCFLSCVPSCPTVDRSPPEQGQSHQVLHSPDLGGSGTPSWGTRTGQRQRDTAQGAQEGADQGKWLVVLLFNTGWQQTPFVQASHPSSRFPSSVSVLCTLTCSPDFILT